MTKQDMKQIMLVCVSTLKNLNGCMPEAEELYTALGEGYAEVLIEYLSVQKTASLAA